MTLISLIREKQKMAEFLMMARATKAQNALWQG